MFNELVSVSLRTGPGTKCCLHMNIIIEVFAGSSFLPQQYVVDLMLCLPGIPSFIYWVFVQFGGQSNKSLLSDIMSL